MRERFHEELRILAPHSTRFVWRAAVKSALHRNGFESGVRQATKWSSSSHKLKCSTDGRTQQAPAQECTQSRILDANQGGFGAQPAPRPPLALGPIRGCFRNLH